MQCAVVFENHGVSGGGEGGGASGAGRVVVLQAGPPPHEESTSLWQNKRLRTMWCIFRKLNLFHLEDCLI